MTKRNRNESFVTDEEGIFLIGVVSEDTLGVKINGEEHYVSSDHDFGIYFPLETGVTIVSIELTDSAGNISNNTVTLERIA